MKEYAVITNEPIVYKIQIFGRYGMPTGHFKHVRYPAGVAFKKPSEDKELAEKYADKLRRCHGRKVSVVSDYVGEVIFP